MGSFFYCLAYLVIDDYSTKGRSIRQIGRSEILAFVLDRFGSDHRILGRPCGCGANLLREGRRAEVSDLLSQLPSLSFATADCLLLQHPCARQHGETGTRLYRRYRKIIGPSITQSTSGALGGTKGYKISETPFLSWQTWILSLLVYDPRAENETRSCELCD